MCSSDLTKSREPTKWAIDLELARLDPELCRPFHGLEPYIYDAPRVAASPPPWALFYRPLRGLIRENIWVMTSFKGRVGITRYAQSRSLQERSAVAALL